MIKPSKYDVEIRKLATEIEESKVKLTELKDLRANELCPFKVGDILINSNGKKAKVTAINSQGYAFDGYSMVGSIQLKNGEFSDKKLSRLFADEWKLILRTEE
jgi:hypothetical protein